MILRCLVLLVMLLTSANLWAKPAGLEREDAAHAGQSSKAALLTAASLAESLGDVLDDDDDGAADARRWRPPTVATTAAPTDACVAHIAPVRGIVRSEDLRASIRRARGYAHLPRMDLALRA